MRYLALIFSVLMLAGLAHAQESVRADITFKYHDFSLQMDLYDVSDKYRYAISKTASHELGEEPEKKIYTKKISNPIRVKRGDSKTFVLVVDNPTDKDMYFMASPHMITPVEASRGHYFECLCNHKIYEVKAKSRWYRVVRLDVPKSLKAHKMEVNHSLIGVSEKDAKGKFKGRIFK